MEQNITAFLNKYKSIVGLDKIYKVDANFYYWSRLYKILSLQIFTNYDTVEWKDTTNLRLLLSTADEIFSVELLFINITSFYINDIYGISDFEIDLNDDSAFGNQRLFFVSGDEGHSMGFFCREIEVLNVSQRV